MARPGLRAHLQRLQAQLVLQVILDRLDLRETLAQLVRKVFKAFRAFKVRLVRLDPLEILALLDPRVRLAFKVLLAQPARLVTRVPLVLPDLRAIPAMSAPLAPPETWAPPARPERKAFKVRQVRRGRRDHRALQSTLRAKSPRLETCRPAAISPMMPTSSPQMVICMCGTALLGTMSVRLLALKAQLAQQVRPARPEIWGPLVHKVLWGPLALQEILALPAQRETSVQ